MELRDIQRLMAAAGYYAGGLDGDFGPKSEEAVQKLLERNKPEALKWTKARQRVAAAQVILNAAGFEPGEVDGYSGHNTKEAYNAWDYERTRGTKEVLPGRSAAEAEEAPPTEGKRPQWPKQSGVRAFFGEPGSLACTAGTAKLPFSFRLAWNTDQQVKSFRCHELVADAFTGIYKEAAEHYGEKKFRALGLDLFGGCYNFRKMRGGTATSMHAWGIAADHDPERNQLRWGKDRAEFAKADYNPWWKIVEAHGATSLGRARNYDWMHFQFAGL